MALSNDLIQKFVKLTNESNNTPKQETYAYGTVQKSDGSVFVLLDGATTPTPVTTTSEVITGERVMVLIRNHTATIIGNTSSPAARVETVENIAKEVTEFETVMADKVVADDILAINAIIENLKATVGSFKDLSTEDLEAINAEIDKLHAKYADLDYVTAKDVDILNADIETLRAKIGMFDNISAEEFKAADAEIDNLKSINAEFKYVSAENLKAHYANIDFSNINKAAMEYFYAASGLIENVTVGDQTITGKLVGVTISGDLIEGNTIKAEKLVVKGEDGLYYKLNIEGGSTVTEEITEEDLQNGLDGNNIIAKTITATKISVSDLVAFDATIAGFNITDNTLYSGIKETIDNTTRGVYLDNTGQVSFGDADNFLRFYKDSDGTYKLAISASSIIFSSSKKSVEESIDKAQESADRTQNYIDNVRTYTHTVLSVDGGSTLSYFDFSGYIEAGGLNEGVNTIDTTNIRSSDYIKVNRDSTYTWNIVNSGGDPITPTTYFYTYDLSADTYTYLNSQFIDSITTPSNDNLYLRFTAAIDQESMLDATYELTLNDLDSIVANQTSDIYIGTYISLNSYMSLNSSDYVWELSDTSALKNATELAEKLNSQLNDETDGEIVKIYSGINETKTSVEEVKEEVDNRQRYVQIIPEDPSISLITSEDDESGAKVRLDSEKVSFYRGSTEGAYIGYADSEQPDRTSMAVGKTYVTELFPRVEDPSADASEKKWIGQLCWVARTNGHLSLKVVK